MGALEFTVESHLPSNISTISPSHGPTDGGTAVEVHGDGFNPFVEVRGGGVLKGGGGGAEARKGDQGGAGAWAAGRGEGKGGKRGCMRTRGGGRGGGRQGPYRCRALAALHSSLHTRMSTSRQLSIPALHTRTSETSQLPSLSHSGFRAVSPAFPFSPVPLHPPLLLCFPRRVVVSSTCRATSTTAATGTARLPPPSTLPGWSSAPRLCTRSGMTMGGMGM
jgi:hypothetical protein